VPVQLALSAIRAGDGTLLGFSANYRDITERKRSEAGLVAQTERLRNLAARDRSPEPGASPAKTPGTDRRLIERALGLVREQLGMDVSWPAEFTTSALLAALEARDHYTGEHSHAVVELCGAVARHQGLSDEEVVAVEQVAPPARPGQGGHPRRHPAQARAARRHRVGAHARAPGDRGAHRVLHPHPGPPGPTVRAEHERWDGGGYPTGLGGEDIPIAARSLGHQAALDELRAGAGSQFDPAVIHALLDVLV